MSAAARRWLRWLIPLVLLAIVVFAFRDQLAFIGQAFRELRDAHLVPITLATIAAVISLAAMGAVMQILLRAGQVHIGLGQSTALTLASNAWSTTLPAGPAFSAVLTFQVQRRWGAPAVVCAWFVVISSVISTMWLAVIGIAAVLLGADLGLWSLLATLGITIAATAFIYWISLRPDILCRWAHALLPRANRMLRREASAGLEGVDKQLGVLSTVRLGVGGFTLASAYSLLNRLTDAAVVWFSVWAVTGELPGLQSGVNQTTLMGVLLAYITAKLAGSAQVTPSGLGTVEAAIIATLVATGMTAVDATGTAIIYRAISFALITAIGWAIYFLYYARDGFSGPAQLRERIE
ncbi:TIGR00374 family protein [Corynebacterium yudongzhengii]|uniref:UPF0104 family protein n=1 Tax=Corynebacterium yudongzhengii TaxID=2080740 RepID=A0A2U1T874_9CORY|nr:YbhN family protein [Corynebacterium yudongzhengii]AWB82775.1 TIGR00374 family protein [Corynebacterium yudongzhengii]PWC02165.1 UPF0104 family protein [Corynebacterium yudongzhengii]